MKSIALFAFIFFAAVFARAQDQVQPQSMKVYQNYDFVPGEKVIFDDDFTSDADGEFPAHWSLKSGQAVVNKFDGTPVFALTDGNYVRVAPRIKGDAYLEDTFTVEFDFYPKAGGYGAMMVFFKADDRDDRNILFGTETHTGYFDNELSGNYPGDQESFKDTWHHAALIYRNGQMKCYLDQYRVLVVPEVNFKPQALLFGGIGSQDQPLLFKNVRIANGGGMNTIDQLMKDGKIISHGILFDVNKASIKPQSMGTINDIAKLLKNNANIKLEIDGHTDSDGDADSNMKLSQARADAVKLALIDQGIDGGRLTTKGFGASKPISDNSTLEGKANNRRVEFIKMP